jgi:hypothetical protein
MKSLSSNTREEYVSDTNYESKSLVKQMLKYLSEADDLISKNSMNWDVEYL